MSMPPVRSRIAALYESQDNPRHPMGWPARMFFAPLRTILPKESDLDFDASEATLAQKMKRGARLLGCNPVSWSLSYPGTMILAGGTAPSFVCGLMGLAHTWWGGGGLQGERLVNGCLDQMAIRGRALPALRAINATLSYGLLGLVTELPAAQLGRWGARRCNAPNVTPKDRILGQAAQYTGYGLALALGALLTTGRLVSCAFFMVLYTAILAPGAMLGALWALGSHLVAAREPAPGSGAARPASPPPPAPAFA